MKILVALVLALLLCVTYGHAQKQKASEFFYDGEEALEQNKYTLALAKFNECLRIDPYFMEAYRSRAAAREGLGDAQGAMTDYSIYIESKPDKVDALFSRGVLRYQLGQYLPAREDFRLLLRLPPGETNKILFRQDGNAGTDKIISMQNTDHSDVFSYLGLIETKLKNYKSAFVYMDSAIALAPGEAHYYVNRGMIKENVQDTLGALHDYEMALRIDPNEAAATHNIAVIKRSRGEQAQSEKLLNDAIEQNPALAAPYAARAYYRWNHRNLKGALDDYDHVLALDKDDEESWLYRGMVKEKLKEEDEAFVNYTQAITLKPEYAKAWLARANLLSRMKRYSDAIEDYSVAITWYPEYGLAFYNRAIAQEHLAKHKEACEDINAAEKLKVNVPAELKAKVCAH